MKKNPLFQVPQISAIMKSDLKCATYSELVRNRQETEETISRLRKEIINPNLFYSQVDMMADKISRLLKFHKDLSKEILSREYEPK